MGYWKSKVLPKIKKVFEKNGTKKAAAAAEASKSFDDSKEEYSKAFEEKKTELHTKVVEIYESSSTEIKSLVKERDEAGLKKNSKAAHKFLEELVKIDFPGSKPVSEASSKFGPALVSGPVFFVFEKVSTFIVTEDKEREKAEAPLTETKTEEETDKEKEKVEAPLTETKTEEETSTIKEREIVVEEQKKEEEKPQVVETTEKVASAEPVAAAKVEEQQAETAAPAAKEEEKPAEPATVVEHAEPPKP